jgi:hypothetical protein
MEQYIQKLQKSGGLNVSLKDAAQENSTKEGKDKAMPFVIKKQEKQAAALPV